ncbi:3-oxoacyl-ACP reductase [Variovorax sp. WS11]|uniref:SDR family NAD(P)-dependent oxidoreductase n=1 Tax=Variovorax sp. WS11 TaxID=1105204 RepID=UPI000D0DF976|nr:SDR family NAD(P)-dependent oxidoreductase [Variovorax sp. WS11]NDZ18765.1 SDR family oxidoreductase [Variovorax sp. WS11]PSL82543.1 3-oxoacyl-ACP reductase [Variovorax sp. WS11]
MVESISESTVTPLQPATNLLQGRRIVIVGAASGIGRATAQLFSREGASLALFDVDVSGLTQCACETGGHGFQVDITKEEEVVNAVERAGAALGGIDGVVNAAGIMPFASILETPVADWRRTLDVNLTGTYLVIRSCLPWMQKESAATIVNIASAAGLLPNAPGLTAYAASKGAVVNLGRALAAELAPKIRANTVCPGLVDTPMGDKHRANVGNYALKRMAEPVEIAQAILFLTGAGSSYITGVALAADGGRSFH